MNGKNVTGKELAEYIGVSAPYISKIKKTGLLKSCMVNDKINLICALKVLGKTKKNNKENPPLIEEVKKIESDDLEKLLETMMLVIKDDDTVYDKAILDGLKSKASIIKEFFLAKTERQKFQKETGNLISLEDAKGVVDVMFNPLSRKLDDLHMDLKSRFPSIPLDAIDWLGNYVNDIKKSVENHEWKK